MCSRGMFKRLVPFFLTFAVGLFIASFFVNINAPRFGNRAKRFHEMKQLRIENDRLSNENLRLQDELENKCRHRVNMRQLENQDWESPDVEEPVLTPPPTHLSPPPPPRPERLKRLAVK